MTDLTDKVSPILPMLLEHGKVYLFALFEREDISDKWDIVLSSDWSDGDFAGAVKVISERIIPTLSPQELTSLSRIVVIPSKEPAVSAISGMFNIRGGIVRVKDSNFMGLQIKNAIIFQSQRPGKIG